MLDGSFPKCPERYYPYRLFIRFYNTNLRREILTICAYRNDPVINST